MKKIAVLLLLVLSCFSFSLATHLRCGQITLTKINGLSYRISLLVFTNINSPIRFGDGQISFGDGSTSITPAISNTIQPGLGLGIGTVYYSIEHTFPEAGSYIISYLEPGLESGVINVANSVETNFYLEARIYVDPGTDCSSPEFLTVPIFNQSIGKEFNFSTAAVDNNDYRLVYELVNPLPPGSTNFALPEGVVINPYNGMVSWDTKYQGAYVIGEYLFGVRVSQYSQKGKLIGYTTRNFQVVLEDSNVELKITNPITDINGKILVEANDKSTLKVWVQTEANSILSWEIYADSIIQNNLEFVQYDSTTNIKVGILKLRSSPEIIRDNPYFVTLRAKSQISSEIFSKDIGYLFFTRDIPLAVITGINDNQKEAIGFYPNPFSNFLMMDIPSSSILDVDILNVSGQHVLRTQVTHEGVIETSQLPAGIYFLKITKGSSTFFQKVIKL